EGEERKGGRKGGQSHFPPGDEREAKIGGKKSDPDPLSALSVLDGILAACDEIARERPMGDTLIFLPGEREIRDAHQALEGRKYRHTEVLPLYARLSARDQDRVFDPGPQRRIALATHVGDPPLTVPSIHAVVGPGLAPV